MSNYFSGLAARRHGQADRIGVLVINLGTPDAPTPGAVRRYLREFLMDRRVIELPRWLWWMLLNFIILPIRGFRSAANYKKVWRSDGSPLMVYTRELSTAIAQKLSAKSDAFCVEMAMNYGNPSIATGLDKLIQAGARRFVILPLYPQYSGTTTGSVFDRTAAAFSKLRWVGDVRFISQYYERPDYIEALASSVEKHWAEHGRGQQMLLSFHGIPERYFKNGDLYHCHCYGTARLLRERLNLSKEQCLVSFQSRVGKEKWLEPYTDATVKKLAESGIKTLDVLCPGFAVDCLETIEEISGENAEIFEHAGGQSLRYIEALNASAAHAELLHQLVLEHAQGWPESSQSAAERKSLAQQRAQRAETHQPG